MDASIVLVGVGSDGNSVEQWDGHQAARGVMLRWFAPDDIGFPDYGFDVYRAFVDDVHPFRFDDAAVADLVGRTRALVDGRIELSTTDPAGLQFQPYGFSNALVLPAGTTLTLAFPGRAWDLYLGTSTFGGPLTVEAYAAGLPRGIRMLLPGQQENWRTPGLDRVEVTGDGWIAMIGYRLVNATYQWSLLGHRSLPVSDAGYPDPAKPAAGGEEAEAMNRLPPGPHMDWKKTYGPNFKDLLGTLTSLALHQAAPAVPAPADPDDPSLDADLGLLFRTALVDPHIGRITGLAWDDTTAAVLNQLLAYKVVGRWRGGTFTGRPGSSSLAALNPVAQQRGTAVPAFEADLGGGPVEIVLGVGVEKLGLDLVAVDPLDIVAFDVAGNQLDRQSLADRRGTVTLAGSDITRVEIVGSGLVSITAFHWRLAFVERYGLIPGMDPADPGPPAGPAWLTATQAPVTDSQRVQVALDWDTGVLGGSELAPLGVQVGGRELGPLGPQPAVPPFRREYLLRDGGVAITPSSLAGQPSPRALLSDAGSDANGLTDGWYVWWVRGVDLFGRCSPAAPPATLEVVDAVPPPPPSIVLAEYVQADLPESLVTVLGRSPLAAAWLAAHPDRNALACCLAWTPEQFALAPDVDAFALYVRRPLRTMPADPRDPAETYQGVAWGGAVTTIGPVQARIAGTVTLVGTDVGITVSAVDAGVLTTDLALDTGSGELAGAVITGASGSYDVIGNGEGAAATVIVAAAAGVAPPVPGPYQLRRGTSRLLVVEAGISVPANAYGGLLVAGDRYRVLGFHGAGLLCVDRDRDDSGPGAPPPEVGATVWWYPAWAITVADTGFGPAASSSLAVARAQVAASAIRRFGTPRAVESTTCAPATVLAVDTTVPATPIVPELPTGDYCARLATAADWYGVSRFTLDIAPTPGVGYDVYRALADAVFRLDHARRHAAAAYSLDLTALWMAPLLTGDRGQIVAADLAALAAIGADQDEAEAAYEAVHADTARILAAQEWVQPAYIQRHGTPLTTADLPYVDEFDGRSRSHWFYRVATRSPAGIASAWSPPTPPICSPDVVPPPPPVSRMALADDLAVKVSWLPVPVGDVTTYDMYRGRTEAEIADPRDLTPVHSMAAPPVTAAPIEVKVDCAPGQWFFRVVAVDATGNRSRPSAIVAGHALQPPPPAPTWLGAQRDGDAVHLTWQPGGPAGPDPRLACLVERRPAGGGFWASISGWLPRAVYEFDDEPPEPDAAWDYRLRTRDTLGQVASVLPTITVPER